MAPRPYWTGYLKLSLVTCAVSLTPATSDREKVRFHTLNSKTGNRVRSRYVDAETGKPVGDDDEVRGYERSEEHTSELQSLMRISYAVFCLKKKKNKEQYTK